MKIELLHILCLPLHEPEPKKSCHIVKINPEWHFYCDGDLNEIDSEDEKSEEEPESEQQIIEILGGDHE
tara:strand:- start:1622 stop:1828 length:207 start_codon:yes stop_codon:yes gene_type:complete